MDIRRRQFNLWAVVILVITLGSLLAACQGPPGQAGPPGPQGERGLPGIPGPGTQAIEKQMKDLVSEIELLQRKVNLLEGQISKLQSENEQANLNRTALNRLTMGIADHFGLMPFRGGNVERFESSRVTRDIYEIQAILRIPKISVVPSDVRSSKASEWKAFSFADAKPGQVVRILGRNFNPGELVTLRGFFSGFRENWEEIKAIVVPQNGKFETEIAVPFVSEAEGSALKKMRMTQYLLEAQGNRGSYAPYGALWIYP